MSAIFVFTTETTQPRPQVFSVNGALTCKEAVLLTSLIAKFFHFFFFQKLFFVIGSWLWGIMHVVLANQNRGNILTE